MAYARYMVHYWTKGSNPEPVWIAFYTKEEADQLVQEILESEIYDDLFGIEVLGANYISLVG